MKSCLLDIRGWHATRYNSSFNDHLSFYVFWVHIWQVICLNVATTSSVVNKSTHILFIMLTAKGNMLRNRIRPHILVLVIISIDVYCDSLFFSPVVTIGKPAHVCALKTTRKAAIVREPLQDLVQEHSSNQSLTCSHPEFSHVLRDSEFQGSSQVFASRFLYDSLLDTHVYTGNQRKAVVGRTRCYLSLNRTIYILAHWCCLSLGGNCTYNRWNSEAPGIDYLRIPIPLRRGQTFSERISVLWQFEVHQSYPVQQKHLLCPNQLCSTLENYWKQK